MSRGVFAAACRSLWLSEETRAGPFVAPLCWDKQPSRGMERDAFFLEASLALTCLEAKETGRCLVRILPALELRLALRRGGSGVNIARTSEATGSSLSHVIGAGSLFFLIAREAVALECPHQCAGNALCATRLTVALGTTRKIVIIPRVPSRRTSISTDSSPGRIEGIPRECKPAEGFRDVRSRVLTRACLRAADRRTARPLVAGKRLVAV